MTIGQGQPLTLSRTKKLLVLKQAPEVLNQKNRKENNVRSMAALASSSSSSLLFSSPSSKFTSPSLHPLPRLSLSSASSFLSSSYPLSISPSSFSAYPTTSTTTSRRSFTVRASTADKKKVLIVNTNSGGHAVIGFYFAKELLGSGHDVTIFTVGDESSDKMKKPPFNRFSVSNIEFPLLAFFYLFF